MIEAGIRACQISGNDLLGRSVPDAPLRTGELRGSGVVMDPEHRADGGVDVVVAFTARHAAVQHEREDYAHPRGGKAKYLEANLLAMSPRYAQAIAASVERAKDGAA